MALPTISALPTAPNRSQDNATFAANADAFVAALAILRNELNAWANQLPSEVSGIDYNATSTTSLAIGTGSKSLTIQTGKLLQVGQFVMIASTESPSNYMMGQVTSHNRATGALTVNITSISGTGTFSAWTISLALASTIYATLTGSEALTNKTINLASNTITGTIAQFNAALSDGDFASIAGAENLTNKTLTDPAIVGTILEDVFTITDGAAFEIDPGNGSIQIVTLGASRTPKATNMANGESVTLAVDDGAAYTLTWTDTSFGPSGVKWLGGSAPTLATTGLTWITLWKVGGQVYGSYPGASA